MQTLWEGEMKKLNMLQRQPSGGLIDWGREATVKGKRGEGGARYYTGEAAEVMQILLKHWGMK